MNIGGAAAGIGGAGVSGGPRIGISGTKNSSGTTTTGSKSPTKKPTNGGNTLGIGL